jgi:hypothetical protein
MEHLLHLEVLFGAVRCGAVKKLLMMLVPRLLYLGLGFRV